MEIGRPSGPRKSVNLLVKLAEEGEDHFVEEKFATDLSSGGMFVWTREPRMVGTGFEVRVEIAGGARLLQARALVRWIRKPDHPDGPPGMGLEFTNVDPASAALIDRMLAPPDPDLAAELADDLVEGLGQSGTAPAEGSAFAPPVQEEGAPFVDDYAPEQAGVGPEEFAEELETAPAGVLIPKHLQHGAEAAVPPPVEVPLADGVPDTPRAMPLPKVTDVPLEQNVPDTPRARQVPIEDDVPDTDPRGQAISAVTIDEDSVADTPPRGLPIPAGPGVPLEDDVPDTQPRGLAKLRPEGLPEPAGVLETQPRGLAIPPSVPVKLRPQGMAESAASPDTQPRGLVPVKLRPQGLPEAGGSPLGLGVPDTQPRGLAIPPSVPVKLRPQGLALDVGAHDTGTHGLAAPSPDLGTLATEPRGLAIPPSVPVTPLPRPESLTSAPRGETTPVVATPGAGVPTGLLEALRAQRTPAAAPPPGPPRADPGAIIPLEFDPTAPPEAPPAPVASPRPLVAADATSETPAADRTVRTPLPPAPAAAVGATIDTPAADRTARTPLPPAPAPSVGGTIDTPAADRTVRTPLPPAPAAAAGATTDTPAAERTVRTPLPPAPAPAAGATTDTPAADRTARTLLPLEPPKPAVPGPTTETPAHDRTGRHDVSDLSEVPAEDRTGKVELPPALAEPRVLAANPFGFGAPPADERVLASNPIGFAPPAPSDPSPLAAPRTDRGQPSGLKPAVVPRPTKKDPVDISVKELVRTTPKPAADDKTSVVVDPTLVVPPGLVPRGVLKPVAVRRGKKTDELAFLGPPPDFVKDSPLVGIDLGTTNSVCAVLAGGRPVVLKTQSGSSVVPSLVAVNKLQKLAVGYAAHAEMLFNPANCISGSKRLVGRDFDSPAVSAVRERFAYEVVAGPDGRAAVMLGGKVVSLEEIQAIVLTECRVMAEKFLNKRVSRAVITCPAYFTEAQRQSIRVAGALAGLRVERILIEPTAAAIAYGLNQELSRKVLVYDVGGGTFDATLLRIEKNVFEVLATGGDVFLGGLDFDHQLIEGLVKRFEDQHGVPFSADAGALARIADQAEKAKVALSEKESVEVRLPMLQLGEGGQPLGLSCTLTRKELEEHCVPLIERTIELVHDLLKDGKLKPADVDEVVLVGGMSRMPMVRERLRDLFKKQPHASVNAEEAIAVGAALFTGVIDKVSNVVLIDVAPMTIGIGLPGGGYQRLIARNTPLPASASIGIATTEDDSDVLELSVFQGEDADVAVNDYVGTIRIDGLPRMPKGLVKLAINLRLDADCVLHVEARELQTRRLFETTLATRYTTGEVQHRLGIKPQAAQAAANRRTEEMKRSSGVFGFLRSVVSRKKTD